jgi:glycosyltransferase involved in cell wall biosynthesis
MAPDTNLPTQRWIVAQEGSRQTYAVPVSFHRLNLLRLLYVDIWWQWGRSLLRHGPALARALGTRFNSEIPLDRVVSFTSVATLWRAAQNLRRRKLSRSEMSDEFCSFGRWYALRIRHHLRQLELNPEMDCFFGFNSNCLEALEFLKTRRVFTILDQVDPGLVEENIVLEEAGRWPGWEGVPGRMSQRYWDRVQAEWAAADLVLVNSNWSRDALVQQGVPIGKIIVVPLAIDLERDHLSRPINPKGDLKVLWLGSVILRKGIQYLVEAARLLQKTKIEFLLAGPLGISEQAVRSFPGNIKVLGRVTRDQLGHYYQQAHVFVLPTLSDGFAITQLEAMAHGLPVVTTPNCGNVVTDGVDGFIVPARDGRALADALSRLDSSRPLLSEMSGNALQTVNRYDLPSNAKLIDTLALNHRRSLLAKESLSRSPTAAML